MVDGFKQRFEVADRQSRIPVRDLVCNSFPLSLNAGKAVEKGIGLALGCRMGRQGSARLMRRQPSVANAAATISTMTGQTTSY